MPAMRILVVDDERAVRESLERALRLEGYDVVLAENGQQGLDRMRERASDAVVLDVLMPCIGGVELCRMIRASGDRTPVLMLTARDAVAERIAGLDAGADDYLTKPFVLEELTARLRALLRRSNGLSAERLHSFADMTLDTATLEVNRAGRPIELTRTEFTLLLLFMQHPRQVLTRTQIMEHVWGYDFSRSSNSLEVYVGYLRRKLEANGEQRLIQTARGIGYSLRAA